MRSGIYRGKPDAQPVAVVVTPEAPRERSIIERIFMPTGDPSLAKKPTDKAVALVDIKPPEKTKSAVPGRISNPSKASTQSAPSPVPITSQPGGDTKADSSFMSSLFGTPTQTKPGEYSKLREFGTGTAQFLGNLGNNLIKNYAGNEALNAGFAQKRLEYADRDPASNSSVLTRGMARALGMPIKGDESAFDLKQQMPYVRDMLAARAMQGREGGGDVGQRMPKPPTEAQAKAKSFADRMAESQGILSELEQKAIANEEGGYHTGQFQIDSLPERAKSEARKRYEQAQRTFVNSILRRESGAVISPEEAAEAKKQYFPQPGDSVELLKQKRQAREIVTRNMALEASPASDYESNRGGGESVMQDKSGKRYRVKDGKVIGEL